MCTCTVSCFDEIFALAYWDDTIATGSTPCDITIFDAVTGSQTAILSGHTHHVLSLTFSLDGTLLVSGSSDTTIKLWDVQTGGVVKTYHGHTQPVTSVSISVDNTMIASGSDDRTVRLWDISTRQCNVIVEHKNHVTTVSFFPKNPQLLLSASNDGTVRQWDINGHQIGPSYAGFYAAFSSDGTQFVSCAETAITVRNTDSGATVAEFYPANKNLRNCCFSPDGRFIAVSAGHTIYLWSITGLDPHLVKTFIGHTDDITSLVFSSSLTLISTSEMPDGTVKFWHISASSADQVTPDTDSTLITSAPIPFVSLQSKDGLAFSIDSAGVVKTWDILTGLCKESFKTEAKCMSYGDIQLISGRLIIVWCDMKENRIHVWDAEKGILQTVDTPQTRGLRITEDGSRVLQLNGRFISAWSIWTGELAGKETLEVDYDKFNPLRMDGSKVLVCYEESTQGWDFGIPGSTPILFSEASSDRPRLDCIDDMEQQNTSPVRVKDRVTGKEVFQLSGRYTEPSAIQWDGQYLIVGYESGEVLILDFGHVLLE